MTDIQLSEIQHIITESIATRHEANRTIELMESHII